ncbi:hypothetical protein E2C01_023646 [Portunus trituberculatus]|uniref:Uncharacterized protein n=1 Tax=Portunus trituberculatus TaxID=210409 RepID=A0A5B7EC54_PORTR|nr:hypothetical protein [Portunus trituberculatus]
MSLVEMLENELLNSLHMCSELLTIVNAFKTFIPLRTQAVTCVCINILLNSARNTPLRHLYRRTTPKCQRKPHCSETKNKQPAHMRTLIHTHTHPMLTLDSLCAARSARSYTGRRSRPTDRPMATVPHLHKSTL